MHTPSVFSILGLVTGAVAKGVWTTPHDKYSSSIGVLGCKINTNRVAYWPGSVDCDNICVKLSYQGRSVHLLRIDQSGGAYDISYDAWAYLQTGKSATTKPISGGSVAMEYEEVDASECADLIYTKDSKLPLSASNSMGYVSSCLSQPNSWVAKNHVLYNICDAICTLGFDEECSLDLATSNQPSCPHTLGLTSKLSSAPVYDIEYTSGKKVEAGSGKEAPTDAKVEEVPEEVTTDESSVVEVPAPQTSIEAPVETSSAPAFTSASRTRATGGIFHQLTSSEAPVEPTSTLSNVIVVPTSTPEPIAIPSSQEVVSLETSTTPVAISTVTAASSAPSLNNSTVTLSSASTYLAPTKSQSHTTLSVSTFSAGPSTTLSSPPSQETPPHSAGRPAASVTILGLGLSIVIGSLGSLL